MTEPLRIQAVILDWAGTVVDHGSRAPMGAFVRAFAELGVPISVADARGPMGMAKRDHIRAVGTSPAVAAAWRARHGHTFGDADVEAVFAVFEPLNVSSVLEHADFIPGCLEALGWLKGRGIRVGSTTGYTRPIMEKLLPLATAAGYAPEVVLCAGDLPAGRPSPLMMWHAMAQMGVWPAATVVKVDDTPVGVAEGRAAGAWSVGVALTGNIAELSAEQLGGLTESELGPIRARATSELVAGGADLVIDSVAQLPDAIVVIEARMAAGERPQPAG